MLEICSPEGPNTGGMPPMVAKGALPLRLPTGSIPESEPGRSTACSRAPVAPRFGATAGARPQSRALAYSRDQPQPAQLLIVAILHRALEDLHLGGRFRAQAMAWLHEHQSEPQPGSFEWCCAAVGLDAGCVRQKYRAGCVRAAHT